MVVGSPAMSVWTLPIAILLVLDLTMSSFLLPCHVRLRGHTNRNVPQFVQDSWFKPPFKVINHHLVIRTGVKERPSGFKLVDVVLNGCRLPNTMEFDQTGLLGANIGKIVAQRLAPSRPIGLEGVEFRRRVHFGLSG